MVNAICPAKCTAPCMCGFEPVYEQIVMKNYLVPAVKKNCNFGLTINSNKLGSNEVSLTLSLISDTLRITLFQKTCNIYLQIQLHNI